MDKLRFDSACELVRNGGRLIKGIGTLGESSVHAVLKNYFEFSHESQEMRIGRYVADIVGENGIIEIQTSHFSALKEKLATFLPAVRVTVVYPVYINKRIVYINEDGTEKRARISPLKGSVFSIFHELYHIAEFLKNENLTIKIVVLDCDEYRVAPSALGKPRSKGGKFSVFDRFPTKLLDEITISAPHEWVKLIPNLREYNYTVSDVSAVTHAARKQISMALAVLYRSGILLRTGKKGRAFAYSYFEDEAVGSPTPVG